MLKALANKLIKLFLPQAPSSGSMGNGISFLLPMVRSAQLIPIVTHCRLITQSIGDIAFSSWDLGEALGQNVYAIEAMRSLYLDDISFVQDPAQEDFFHLENLEASLDSMLDQSDAEVVFERDVRTAKGKSAMRTTWEIEDLLWEPLPEDTDEV